MATTIRPEISEKNKYWIDKHRHYELKHFCLQYPKWKLEYSLINIGPATTTFGQLYSSNTYSDPTSKIALTRYDYLERIKMIEVAAREADSDLSSYILKAVTEGLSFTYLKNVLRIPCGRDLYYNRYRKFFWLLDRLRK